MNTVIVYINYYNIYYNNTKISLVLCEQNWMYVPQCAAAPRHGSCFLLRLTRFLKTTNLQISHFWMELNYNIQIKTIHRQTKDCPPWLLLLANLTCLLCFPEKAEYIENKITAHLLQGPYSWKILVLRVAPSNKILRKFLEMWVFPLKF